MASRRGYSGSASCDVSLSPELVQANLLVSPCPFSVLPSRSSLDAMAANPAEAAAAAVAAAAAAAAAANAAAGPSISDLRNTVAELKAQQKRAAQQLKNEEKKRARNQDRARGLSDADLLALLAERHAPAAKAKGKAKGKAKAKAKALAAPPAAPPPAPPPAPLAEEDENEEEEAAVEEEEEAQGPP